jgi:hypothetical protein
MDFSEPFRDGRKMNFTLRDWTHEAICFMFFQTSGVIKGFVESLPTADG